MKYLLKRASCREPNIQGSFKKGEHWYIKINSIDELDKLINCEVEQRMHEIF